MSITPTAKTSLSLPGDNVREPGRTRTQRLFWGIPYGIFTTALALLFIRPMICTAQTHGWGLGNYVQLATFQAGIITYIANSLFVSLLTVALTLFISLTGGY